MEHSPFSHRGILLLSVPRPPQENQCQDIGWDSRSHCFFSPGLISPVHIPKVPRRIDPRVGSVFLSSTKHHQRTVKQSILALRGPSLQNSQASCGSTEDSLHLPRFQEHAEWFKGWLGRNFRAWLSPVLAGLLWSFIQHMYGARAVCQALAWSFMLPGGSACARKPSLSMEAFTHWWAPYSLILLSSLILFIKDFLHF